MSSDTASETDRESTMDGILHEIVADLESALKLFDNVLTREIYIEQACKDEIVTQIQSRMDAYCDKILADSRTARLWLLYIEMVELLREFIKAERTRNRLAVTQLHATIFHSILA